MLKIGISTKEDLNEAVKLQKREQYEEERKKRIFNAKQRLFGLDLDTLERQIAEKNKERRMQKECDRLYEEHQAEQKRLIMNKEKEIEKMKRIMESDVNYYRCRYQRKDQRREFDLNDPDYLKKSKPMRLADDDITLGISSAQIFSGEDLYNKERKRRQHEQQRAWLDQQIMERKQAEQARLKADNLLVESINCRDKRLEDMAKSEHIIRNQLIDKTRQYNMELARQKKLDRERAKREKYEDDMAEIFNMMTSDMLTENPDVAQSRTNPNKKIAFMYRGMSPAEMEEFRKGQEQQLKECERRRTEMQLMDKQWEQHAINMDRQLMLKQLEIDRKRREQMDEFIRTNAHLAVDQKRQREEQEKLLVNSVSNDFYDQFNKTSR